VGTPQKGDSPEPPLTVQLTFERVKLSTLQLHQQKFYLIPPQKTYCNGKKMGRETRLGELRSFSLAGFAEKLPICLGRTLFGGVLIIQLLPQVESWYVQVTRNKNPRSVANTVFWMILVNFVVETWSFFLVTPKGPKSTRGGQAASVANQHQGDLRNKQIPNLRLPMWKVMYSNTMSK